MIHIGLPPPLLPRLRVHWHGVQTYLLRQTYAFQETRSRVKTASQAQWQRLALWFFSHFDLRPKLAARRREQLARFAETYEEMVDLLCWAAKEGVQERQRRKYAVLRVVMYRRYRPVRACLRSHCLPLAEPPRADPFEMLFLPAGLEEVIHAAGGIEVMMSTRAALDACQDALNNGA